MSQATQPASAPRRKRAAFTLVEVMIVICILGVLMNIAAPTFIHARNEGQSRACVKNLKNISAAKEMYALDNNVSSHTFVWTDLTKYMRGTEPVCPTIGATYSYNALGTAPSCTYTYPVGFPQLAHSVP